MSTVHREAHKNVNVILEALEGKQSLFVHSPFVLCGTTDQLFRIDVVILDTVAIACGLASEDGAL